MPEPLCAIVIGASAGGVDALRAIVADLPETLNAAVFVTLHIGTHRSDLPWLLGRAGLLNASHAIDGDPIRTGQIYVAPPDHHLVVDAGRMNLTKGPRENWARPAIDPLFRSAARAYGPNVIGVILTGGLNDGTAGMFEVKSRGGITVVQDPAEAINPQMPQSVIDNVRVDHVVPVGQIGALLTDLVARHSASTPAIIHPTGDSQERGMTAEFTSHRPVAVTCPDCGGALRRSELGTLTQFSCHIGHVYTAEVMLAAQFLAMERSVEMARRSLGERAELCRQMQAKLTPTVQNGKVQSQWEGAEYEALAQAELLEQLLTREWIHPARAHPGARDT